MKLTKPLAGEDAFQVCLLGTCEATHLVLTDRLKLCDNRSIREKRLNWLEKIQKAVEGLNNTYDGYVTEEFEKQFEEYHAAVEAAMTKLLGDTTNEQHTS